ncbi:helix-turn-helix domain-containing protein [Oxynema sp. CENA135]|uniref:helix-turn-helix domain-containing protein n=1 Tax=Oxynema sp. CENA135 TaxID=984206 RepID=UPI0019091847|nr:RodZ domain-containing protein [Oxynema sp. CENA135]MBK4730924.1 helix-turn-helix domain-containing protein [Oxynema sp. CENA135]
MKKDNKQTTVKNPDRDRALKLAEMGAYLRQQREDRRVSLEEIAAQTMIRVSLLRAIEAGQLEKLPEPIYIQGFLLRYADTLGLDGVTFAQEFPIGSKWSALKLRQWYIPLPQFRPIHLYIIYIILIACSVKGLSGFMNGSGSLAQKATDGPQIQVTSGETPGKTNSPGTNLQTVSTQTPSQKQSGEGNGAIEQVRVGLTVKDRSWVQVIADGKTEFEGILPEGTERTWEAKQQLVVRAGNAGGVMVAVNNGQAKQMGAPGEVEEVVVKAAQNPRS